MIKSREHILVIRAGALGDLIFCFQAFEDIRSAHPDAEIALLTRAPFVTFAENMPWFDSVLTDTHPTFTELGAWIRLIATIKKFAPTRVYDLQGKTRQTILYALLGGPFGPEWSGAAPWCHFPRLWPPTDHMSFVQFLRAQLERAGVGPAPPTDLTWLDAQIGKFSVRRGYLVLVPGCSPRAVDKRWPAQRYGELAERCREHELSTVIVGTTGDADVADEIALQTPDVINLCGQTNLFELAGILRHARGVVGNDTGPTHMAAMVGTPTLGLFSGRSNAAWSAPPGMRTAVLQKDDLNDLGVDDVFTALQLLINHAEGEGRERKGRP